jgi:predicted glycoside hydrolase/deacetylase ChbG (UPF0249 family)
VSTPPRNLIVNADDLGASEGVNRGIVDAHVGGVVTSASLMVHGAGAEDAAALARRHPALAIGLHWDLDAGGVDRVPDPEAVRAELAAQLERFEQLLGRPPTHVDGHHHVHQRPEIAPIARALAAPLGVPLRGDGTVTYVGGFYGQWEWQVTDLQHVSVDFLCRILREEVVDEWTEIGCHPGYVTPGFQSVYLHEREEEVRTLTDPRVREQIGALGIRLASFADLAEARAR